MSKNATIELVGGYYDGAIRAVSNDDDMTITFVALLNPVEPVSGMTISPVAEAKIPTVTLQYLRTNRKSSNGHRIYQFVPPRKVNGKTK